MDINFFLFFRKKYNLMLSSINFIIDSYDEIKDYQLRNNIEGDSVIFTKDQTIKRNCIMEKIQILNLIDICNSHIKNICNHEFIDDNIDIDLDNSQAITYCRICELTEDEIFK